MNALKLWQEVGISSDKTVTEFDVRWHGLDLERDGHISVGEADAITLGRHEIVAWHNENDEYLANEEAYLAGVAKASDDMANDFPYMNGMM